MRQIHFDINFENFCCRIKNSFEKSERDPHLGKQLSYSDINTISNSFCFNTKKYPCLQTRPFQICSLSCPSGTSSRWQVKYSLLTFMDVGGWSTHSQDCLSFQIIVGRVATPACWQKRHNFGLKSCLVHRSLTQ